jgi:flagellin-like hook-associated protein FlgL
MIIYNNAPAFSVWKNYSFNVSHLKTAMERLSSGMRIVRPSDDARVWVFPNASVRRSRIPRWRR